MEIQFRKKREQPLNDKTTIPVTRQMKEDLDQIKNLVDVNEMARLFFTEVIQKVRSGEYNQVS